VGYTDFFHEPIEPYRRPGISWFYSPELGQPGLVEIDSELWLVENILGDLEGFDGPQQVGFTFKTLAGSEVKVYFEVAAARHVAVAKDGCAVATLKRSGG
jgi:hypothetical protein